MALNGRDRTPAQQENEDAVMPFVEEQPDHARVCVACTEHDGPRYATTFIALPVAQM